MRFLSALLLVACAMVQIGGSAGASVKQKKESPVSDELFVASTGGQRLITFRDKYRTWIEARDKCLSHGLRLAKPKDAVAVRKFIVENYGNGYTWVGAKGNGDNMEWVGNQGVVSNVSKLWYPGCPGNEVSKDDCLRLLTYSDIMSNLPVQPYASWDCSVVKYTLCEDTAGCGNVCSNGNRVGSQCLSFSETALSWSDAKESCRSLGGRLAVLSDLADPYDVLAYTIRHYGVGIQFWVGASDLAELGTYKWLNGQKVGFPFPWAKLQPDNQGGDEHCMQANFVWGSSEYKPSEYGFNDANCQLTYRYICDYGA